MRIGSLPTAAMARGLARAVALCLAAASCAAIGAAAATRLTWLEVDAPVAMAPLCHSIAATAQSSGAIVDVWFEDLDRLVVKYQQNPLRAARAYVYLATAMRDAWTLAAGPSCDSASAAAAAHLAAGRVVDLLYPQEPSMMWAAIGFGRSQQQDAGRAATSAEGRAEVTVAASPRPIADRIVTAVRMRMLVDGSEQRPPPEVSTRVVGRWVGTAPLYMALPAEPTADRWLTWSFGDIRALRPPPPPAIDSAAYRDEVIAVVRAREKLTAREREIADRWHLDQGSVTPAGVWNRIARERTRAANLPERTRLEALALLHAAMFDAFVAAWDAKLAYFTERPITAIQRMVDPGFVPYLATPQFPSYVSAHAAVSGAAEVVLGRHLPNEATSFSAMAAEAADSRLYGGIHFPVDNREGLALGRRVAAHVLASAPTSAK